MNKTILLIDTTNREKIRVGLKLKGKTDFISSSAKILKSQATLLLIDKILKINALKPEDLDKIEVNTGPGSFTGIRVGIAVGNTLAYVLKIPINGKKVGELVEAVYN